MSLSLKLNIFNEMEKEVVFIIEESTESGYTEVFKERLLRHFVL